jgi:hypothetical protein
MFANVNGLTFYASMNGGFSPASFFQLYTAH